jgi:hypothetical protein
MITESIQELKQRDVLSIGLIESIYQAVFNVYLFIWTPILQISKLNLNEDSNINVGFIYICFVLMLIIGAKFFEVI